MSIQLLHTIPCHDVGSSSGMTRLRSHSLDPEVFSCCNQDVIPTSVNLSVTRKSDWHILHCNLVVHRVGPSCSTTIPILPHPKTLHMPSILLFHKFYVLFCVCFCVYFDLYLCLLYIVFIFIFVIYLVLICFDLVIYF